MEEGKNYFGYNEIVPSPQRLKRRPQMHLRCVSLMKDLIFSKKKTFHIFTEWLSERLLVQMKLNTQKMKEKTTQIHLRP